MKYDLVTFGEAMVRLSPPGLQRLEQTTTLEVHVGGAELNVAVTAQRLGLNAAYVTRLSRNALGRMIANRAREQGVDASHIVWTDEDRVGLYFVEFGASPRASSVLYDRRGSAMANIRPGEVDWAKIFRDARCFHTTGITPALSSLAAKATQEAVSRAKEAGLLVSLDLNYRARLWTQEEARRVMTGLVRMADVLITTEEDTKRVFGIEETAYEKVAERLAREFNLAVVAITVRETPSVWHNTWTAIAYAQGGIIRGPTYDIEVVDRVGAGDAFAGGFLFGYLTDGPEAGVRYGIAASALKQTNPGDLVWATRDEVEGLLKGEGLRIAR
ncbi:MAG: 2-dehydro-3-deoxygluconokinase [Candidatus Bipolaricaulis sibiricus]|uniref:2-dehydro-3-deoxygluconokinase n=1 Tax=Bipolaricaulis sibiricus TaxID=2501609 RepID=A0A410FVJ2_BIPS1|nr:MAG: 2-dehydro-3-deoxygluconokinase [Candidatus Bipolaricaulis sibiricus]